MPNTHPPHRHGDFNPYLKWLGIRSESPDHYQLLGIERFESDADVIVAAADRQMAHVRKYQNGPRSAASQSLLNELAAAKICLLAADKKLAYDIMLASEQADQQAMRATAPKRRWLLGTSIAGLSVTAAVLAMLMLRNDAMLPPQLPRDSAPRLTTSHEESTTPEATPTSSQSLAESVAVPEGFAESKSDLPDGVNVPSDAADRPEVQLVSGLNAIAEAESPQQSKQEKKEDSPGEATSSQIPNTAPLVTVVDVDPTKPKQDSETDSATAPWETANTNRKTPSRPFAGQNSTVARLLQSLQDRNITGADQLQAQVLTEADNEPRREEARRLELIFFKIKEFWEKADQGLEKISVGDTLDFRGVEVTVVQKSAGSLRLKAAGGQEKDFETAHDKISGDLAVALARQNGEAVGIMLDVMCGVFLSIDRDGDRKEAVIFLQRARDNGVPIEVFQAAAKTDAAASEPSSEVLAVDDVLTRPTSAPLGRKLHAVPAPAVRNQKLRMLRKVAYKDGYSQRGPAAERELASRLFLDANQTPDDPEARFVMYSEAIRIASENGDAKTVDTAIRAIVYNFDCREHPLRIAGLKELGRSVRESEQAQMAFDSTVDRFQELCKQGQFQSARAYVPAMLVMAGRSKSSEATRLASRSEQQLNELEMHFQQLQHDLFAYPAPDDAVLHTKLGLFELHKGNEDTAWNHLQNSHLEWLSKAAVAELDVDSSAIARLETADLWWSVSETQWSDSISAKIAHDRAIHWYTSAVNELTGLSKRRASARLKESR